MKLKKFEFGANSVITIDRSTGMDAVITPWTYNVCWAGNLFKLRQFCFPKFIKILVLNWATSRILNHVRAAVEQVRVPSNVSSARFSSIVARSNIHVVREMAFRNAALVRHFSVHVRHTVKWQNTLARSDFHFLGWWKKWSYSKVRGLLCRHWPLHHCICASTIHANFAITPILSREPFDNIIT